MHLDEERIERFLDGELAPADERAAREHLATCDECRQRVADATREVRELAGLLEHLDRPAPRLDADSVAARAQASHTRVPPRESRTLQWAAGFVVALVIAGAGYASYAMPGSPVRAWVTSLATWIGGHPSDAPEADRGAAGISVVPGPRLVIVFSSPQPPGSIRVSLVDGAEVAVHAATGAATFTSDAERLVIDNHGAPATFAIEIPRAAPWVDVHMGDLRIYLKDGTRITASATVDTTTR